MNKWHKASIIFLAIGTIILAWGLYYTPKIFTYFPIGPLVVLLTLIFFALACITFLIGAKPLVDKIMKEL